MIIIIDLKIAWDIVSLADLSNPVRRIGIWHGGWLGQVRLGIRLAINALLVKMRGKHAPQG